ncbi:carbohydrate ABC transporter membrane protein 1 (CUT1 family) [Salana multivorans]|uniref:Carbohydrate ABC transporter membrane protein 1 (CUT1 family) n=1 Tax=Salana multivorans TaxID=120377 RepID=A0A3N2DAP5_9MICO|nr:sugar ABC transporter permease [Salana multivorans]ROR96718.1 carbohydrate ABC transporter membrane protein 1 (CUT1 family) [Salana multivorans]
MTAPTASPPGSPATPVPGDPRASAPRRRHTTRRVQAIAPIAFVGVTVVLFLLFFVWPGALAVMYSFTNYRGVGEPDFIGLANYQKLLADSTFYGALTRTFLYTVLNVPAHYVVSLAVAVLLASSLAKGKASARVVFFLPWLISPIVAGVIWRWLFGENFGLVNEIIKWFNGTPVHWETDATAALILIIIVSTWGSTAFNMLLFVAAIRNIPRSYLEAAELDGASAWQRFRSITLPLLAPTSFMVILLTTIGSMKEFAMIQSLNGGGPGTQNMFIVQYIYRTGFERADIGYASAASMVLMVILIVVALVQMRLDRKRDLS